MSARDLSQLSMLELFRLDAETQLQALTGGLLALEREATAAEQLEICMRASHSLKGAARIVGLDVGVKITHAMEDCFVAAQLGAVKLRQTHIDVLLRGVDLLTRIAATPEAETSLWVGERSPEISEFLATLTAAILSREVIEPVVKPAEDQPPVAEQPAVAKQPAVPLAELKPVAPADDRETVERVLRVTAENLNRLLGLAGESLVESRWLEPYAASMLRLKRLHRDVGKKLDGLREILAELAPNARTETALADARHRVHECHQLLSQRLEEIEMFDGRSTNLAHRLYDAVLACRMRPFADGVRAFPRTVRDLGRSLGKQVRLQIVGEATQVDRDILEKLDAPLGHLLRNAIDHGIESAQERLAAGKPAEGVVRLEARHSAGLLQISVTDDGRGMDLDRLRIVVVERKLTSAETARALSEAELLEFLFLPGFSTKDTVTEISGRGVGLDVVQEMIKQVRGTIRVSSQPGKGACFQLLLPLTLSVVRTLLVEIGGEPYAFPLAHIVRTLKLPRGKVEVLEGRQHFNFEGRSVGLVNAQQVLGGREPGLASELPVLIVGDHGNTYGLIADRFLGERELVVQPLDVRFGKIKDISAGALMEDGLPVLIVDVEDLLHSVEKLISVGRLSKVEAPDSAGAGKRQRVLVVDDSLTVRELERKLLDHAGYDVEVAVDGMDGWNMVRTGHFDLIVTDIDMPRMDGIELVTLIKKDPNLKSLPVMIVSYKDREEDRQRGLKAGANYYLTKGSFHDETLLRAVLDLIGAAAA
jgi:two-component system, chemotaxis family, sensor histidine kinase and response regulator WspE